MRCRVTVELRRDILDPQGKAIGHALHMLGFTEVRDVRVGKVIELELEGEDQEVLAARVEAMCRELLANPVIEDYRVEW